MHGLPADTSRPDAEEGINQTLALMQLSHAGRQSSNFIGGRPPFRAPLAPSAVRVGTNADKGLIASLIHKIAFQVPRAMSLEDIHEVISKFARGAEFACRAGFDGVQLHVAHGCEYFMEPPISVHLSANAGFD